MSSSPETQSTMSCHQHCYHTCQSLLDFMTLGCSRLWVRPSQKRRTSVQPEGKHATWNESFHLPVDIVTRQKLVVVLLDHDTIGSDDELGRSLPTCSSLACSLTHTLTYLLACSHTLSVTCSSAPSLTHPLNHSLPHSLARSLAHSLTHSLTHSLYVHL